MMRTTALSLIRESGTGDAWSGQDRGDSAGPLSRGPFDQRDQSASGRVARDVPEGFVDRRDRVRLRAQDAAGFEDRPLAVGA